MGLFKPVLVGVAPTLNESETIRSHKHYWTALTNPPETATRWPTWDEITTFADEEYRYDSYSQAGYLRVFTEMANFDALRFRTPSAVEYHDGLNWVAWAGGAEALKPLLDGREDTGYSVDHTHRRFRFEISRNGAWPTTALIVLQSHWTGITYPRMQVRIETWDGVAWVLRSSSVFDSTTTGGNWGIHLKAEAGLHNGESLTRVEIEIDDWVDSGAYTTVPLRRFMLLSNYNGGRTLPWTWNWDKTVAFDADLSFAGTLNAGSVPWARLTGVPSYEPAFSKNTAFNKNFGSLAGTVTEGNDSRLSDARAPTAHTHAWADITGEPVYTQRWPTWTEVTSKPTTFTPSAHTHTESEISDLGDYMGRLATYNDTDLDVIDTAAENGLYRWTSVQPLGTPGWTYGAMLALHDGGQTIQLAFGGSSHGNLAIRRKDSGTWYPWTEFWSTNNFDPSTKSDTGHTHSYLPLTGGTIGGTVVMGASSALVPDANGQRFLGTNALRFSGVYAFTFYEGGTALNLKYAPINGSGGNEFAVQTLVLTNLEVGNVTSSGQLAFDLNDTSAPAGLGPFNGTDPVGLYIHDGVGIRRIWTTDNFDGTNVANWQTAYGWGNHAGQYLPLAGGTLTGNVTLSGFFNTNLGNSTHAATLLQSSEPPFQLRGYQGITGIYALTHEIGLTYNDVKNAMIKFYRGSSTVGGSIRFSTNNDTEMMALLSDGKVAIGGTTAAYGLQVHGTAEADTLYENGTALSSKYLGIAATATAATKLATARTIDITGDITATAVAFDGTANIAISASVNDDSHNHIISNVDGLQTALDQRADFYTTFVDATAAYVAGFESNGNAYLIGGSTNTTGSTGFPAALGATWGFRPVAGANSSNWGRHFDLHKTAGGNEELYIRGRNTTDGSPRSWQRFFADNYHPNADTLTTSRTISLTGDVTGSVGFDGSADVSITATVVDDSHNHIISNVDGLQTALDGKLPLAGGTLEAASGNTELTLQKTGSTGQANIVLNNELGVSRWRMGASGATDDDWYLARYNDAGTYQDNAIFVDSVSGVVDFANTVYANSELYVGGTASSTGGLRLFKSGEHFYMRHSDYSGNIYIQATDVGGIARNLIVGDPDGNTTIYADGTARLAATTAGASVTGALTASGNVTAYSDARLKGNVNTIDNALLRVGNMRGVFFTRNDDETLRRFTGVIAQEMQAALPEVVFEGEDETLSVDYGNVVGVLIEAIKELKTEVELLKAAR